MEVRQPSSSRFNGDFVGKPMKLYTEIIAQGMDARLVRNDLAAGRTFEDHGPGKPVPVLANSRLLEIYNKTFAPQRGLPKLTPELLAGFQMPVAWGQSFVAGNSDKAQIGTVELVGFSSAASPLGLAMPLEAARRLNRELGRDADTYTSVVLRVDSPERIGELTNAVRRMGFDVDDGEQRLARQVGFGITVVTSALAALSLLITLLAAVNIAHAFHAQVRERRREIGLMRALGASRRDVLLLLLSEAAIVGLGGGLAGLLAGLAAVRVVDYAALTWLPDFPYKPETFFLVTPQAVLAGLAVAAAAAMGGAWGPARTASASDPSVALTE
jgi:putative ABC transport system permease protein